MVMKLLDTNEGRVTITSNMWTTNNRKRLYGYHSSFRS